MQTYYYHTRPELLASVCDDLLGSADDGELQRLSRPNVRSGIFFAAIRRIGKSMFMTRELLPEIQRRGVAGVYVDLWADTTKPPSILMKEALQRSMRDDFGGASKALTFLKKSVSKLGVAGFLSIDLKQVQDQNSFVDLLQEWSDMRAKARKDPRIVVIIDEAQQALNSADGAALLLALKSARDQLNDPSKHANLIVVCTGSHRAKLTSLVTSKDSAFYLAQIRDFPKLDRSFTDALTARLNTVLKAGKQFSALEFWEGFKYCSHRPELLEKGYKSAIAAMAANANATPDLELRAAIKSEVSKLKEELATRARALTPLQLAVLCTAISKADLFSPFDKDSLAEYSQALGETVPASSVQTALNALLENGILWKRSRGGYFLEDDTWLLLWDAQKKRLLTS